MEAYIIIALLVSLVGGVGTAAGKILYQSYREERLFLEGSDDDSHPLYYSHPELEESKKN